MIVVDRMARYQDIEMQLTNLDIEGEKRMMNLFLRKMSRKK